MIPAGGHGQHGIGDSRLILPDKREYDHFALHHTGTFVYDWPEPVAAADAYDLIYNSPDPIVKAAEKLAGGASFMTVAKALGEHLAASRYISIQQIQIKPRSKEILVIGDVAEGEVTQPGEIRDADIERTERVAHERRKNPGNAQLWKPSGGASLRRGPKGRKHLD